MPSRQRETTRNPVERQQTRWIIFGVLSYLFAVIVWILIFGSTLEIPAGQPRLLANVGAWTFINAFALLILPAAITIAILRYRLWNIDVVINRALVYGGMTLELIAAGENNQEIAQHLHISAKTVSNHISNIFNKLQVADRA